MKKTYSKPMVYIEEFELSQQIAAGCMHTEGATKYRSSCGITNPQLGMTFFAWGTCADGEPGRMQCLDTPSEAQLPNYFFS